MKLSSLSAAATTLVLAGSLLSAGVPAPANAASPAPCGGTIYKSPGVPWVCTFDEEFSGTTLNPKRWVAQVNVPHGNALAAYSCTSASRNNISVSAGVLHLTVRKLATPVQCGGLFPAQYSSGSIMTWRLWSQAYGRFTARMMSPATTAPGLHEAFWLWHDERYTASQTGEMDIAETYSKYPTLAIPTLHNSQNSVVNGVSTQVNCQAPRGTWNTYTMVWSPHRITISINGVTCLVNTSGDPAFALRNIILLSAVAGQDDNTANTQTPFPATTLVDYVRVWK